jgi:hypothetical protein
VGGDQEVHKGHVVALGKKHYGYKKSSLKYEMTHNESSLILKGNILLGPHTVAVHTTSE